MKALSRKIYKPLTPKQIDRLLHGNRTGTGAKTPALPEPIPMPEVKEPVRIFPDEPKSLCRSYDYDSLHPVESLKTFLAFLRSVTPRYNDNYAIVGEMDKSLQDVLHKIEMADDMGSVKGYEMYRKTRELRRMRRIAKNENELLEPLKVFIEQNPTFIPSFERMQGELAQSKERIDGLRYFPRTKVLEEE